MRRSFGSPVLDTATRLLAPFLFLFAAYVVLHGHYSPGGGFQGGAVGAAGLIAVRLVRGRESGWGIGRDGALLLACAGVGLYAAVGFLAFAGGKEFLDYGGLALPASPVERRLIGTMAIEIGVALGVAGVLTMIYDALVSGRDEE